MNSLTNQGLSPATSIERRGSNGTHAPPMSPAFQVAGHQQHSPIGHAHLTPPLDSSSPHSSLSSPSSSTPPHLPHTDSTAIYERSSRPMVPPAVLAPVDYTTRAMHKTVPLKAIPARSPSPVDTETSSSSPTLGRPSLVPPPPSSPLLRALCIRSLHQVTTTSSCHRYTRVSRGSHRHRPLLTTKQRCPCSPVCARSPRALAHRQPCLE